MYPLLLIAFLPQISAYVDCKVACYRCRENKEHPLVLEVHCAMCNECKQRRRDRLSSPPLDSTTKIPIREGDHTTGHSKEVSKHSREHTKEHLKEHSHEHEDASKHSAEDSDECPTPPPCESEEIQKLKATVTIPRTTETMATTTKKQCPPVVTCRKKKRKKCSTYPSCVPCMPMCMAPCPLTTLAATITPQTVKTTDYYYVYVGVPKGLINNKI